MNLFLCFFSVLQHLFPLLGNALLTPLAGILDLLSTGCRLVTEQFGSGLLCLPLVDELHEDTLVFEAITFAFHVQLMVQMLINFLCFSVLSQQAAEDPHATD